MTQQQTSSSTLNDYVGRHRPTIGNGASWRPSPEYGDVPSVPAGFGISLGAEPHLILGDVMGGVIRVDLSPEDVEHILVEARQWQERFEARAAEQSREIEESLERQDRFFRGQTKTGAAA